MRLDSLLARMVELVSPVIVPRRALAEVTESNQVIADLGTSFDGYTIVALADFHHRHPFDDVRWLRHAVDTVNGFAPDIVALLGDYASSFKQTPALSTRWYAEALPAMTSELQRLRARDGVLGVLGNHDYYVDPAIVKEWLHTCGVKILINSAMYVHRSGGVLRFAGLDDSKEGAVDPLVGCGLHNQPPTVMLSHEPDGILHVDSRLRLDIMLAGHTHGGQIALPWYGAPITMSRTCGRRSAHGWVPNARASLLVTRGLGEQLPLPIRIGCPPEIVVLRLHTCHQQPA